jgi:hypothetical protein
MAWRGRSTWPETDGSSKFHYFPNKEYLAGTCHKMPSRIVPVCRLWRLHVTTERCDLVPTWTVTHPIHVLFEDHDSFGCILKKSGRLGTCSLRHRTLCAERASTKTPWFPQDDLGVVWKQYVCAVLEMLFTVKAKRLVWFHPWDHLIDSP